MSARRSRAATPAATAPSPGAPKGSWRTASVRERVLLTTSCTAALEMAALLCDLGPGDEVILPSYTFVSTANAVVLRGATPVFVDIRPDTLNIDERLIEAAITPRTRAIFPVHYAGVACEMDEIMAIAERHGLLVVEDAAQGVFAKYKDRWLGAIGHLGCYSFHETKNFSCGEGGALVINDRAWRSGPRFCARRAPTVASSCAARLTNTPGWTSAHPTCSPICWRPSWSASSKTWRRSRRGEGRSSNATPPCSPRSSSVA